MLLSQVEGLAAVSPAPPVVVLINTAPHNGWGGGGTQNGWGAGLSRDFGRGSDFQLGFSGIGPWGRPQNASWSDGSNAWPQGGFNTDATNGSSSTMTSGGFGTTISMVGPNGAPAGLAPMISTTLPSPGPSTSASTANATDGNAPDGGRGFAGPMGPMMIRPKVFTVASMASAAMGSTPSATAWMGGPQSIGIPNGTPGPNPGDPPPPPIGPNAAVFASVASMPATAQPLAEPGGAWTGATPINLVGPRGPVTVSQTSVNAHEATKALVIGSPASAPATIAAQGASGTPAGNPEDQSGADGSQAAPNVEAAAPQAAGVLTAFMPLATGEVEVSLAKLLDRIDALGAPIVGSPDRLPIIVPVAVALAAMETARRRLGKTSTPGPVVGRGSRFSSLRGLS